MASTATKSTRIGAVLLAALGLDGPSDPYDATAWAASTAYSVGDYRRPTARTQDATWLFKCVKAGTSGGSEPTWPTAAGEFVSDNGVQWQAMHRGLKASLFNSDPGFVQDNDTYYGDITTANELATANGYTNGGTCINDGKMSSYDSANDRYGYTGDATQWTASGGSIAARYAVVRLDRGTNALSPILCVHDWGATQTAADGAPWKIKWNSVDDDGAIFYI